ncbi:MAG: hypothetical protein RI924_1017 [Bacteroidota bacterium]|jgi:hypothetical protein
MQTTSQILLIKPAHFGFNLETAASNSFQQQTNEQAEELQQKALQEFEAFAAALQAKGLELTIFEDTADPIKPDAVFPNNWISFHPDGTVILYPMYAPNRRLERRMDIVESLKKTFQINRVLDWSAYENQSKFLEGTGSVVFDHVHQTAYACLSPRTDQALFLELCRYLNYKPVYFSAYDAAGKEIYHTNVMMCIGEQFALICLESIHDKQERALVMDALSNTGHQVIEITLEQMSQFAGNMLCLKNRQGDTFLVLSGTAHHCLSHSQKEKLSQYAELLPLNISTIEKVGGGSVRCMIAEVFLPK